MTPALSSRKHCIPHECEMNCVTRQVTGKLGIDWGLEISAGFPRHHAGRLDGALSLLNRDSLGAGECFSEGAQSFIRAGDFTLS